MPIETGFNMVYTIHVIKVKEIKGGFKMNKYDLFVGLNDKDTRKQEIETDKAIEIVKSLCWEMFEGTTVSLAYGLYKHGDGEKVSENTIRIELMTDDKKGVKNFVNDLKKIFNQESIMSVTTVPVIEFL